VDKRRAIAYLGGMSFIKHIRPAGAVTDIIALWRQTGRERYLILAAACVPAALLFYMFQEDSKRKSEAPPPQIIYVESWSADRSMEDILADQAERQQLRAQAAEQRRETYKALGRAVGMDVEAIEREAAAQRAAEAAETSGTEAAGGD
jgi:hypothetical protein